MTAKELNELMSVTGKSIATIYRAAQKVGNTPTAWQVEYYAGPRGRKPRFISAKTRDAQIAKQMWDTIQIEINNVEENPRPLTTRILYEFMIQDASYHLIRQILPAELNAWDNNHSSATDNEFLFQIVKQLKKLIYGG